MKLIVLKQELQGGTPELLFQSSSAWCQKVLVFESTREEAVFVAVLASLKWYIAVVVLIPTKRARCWTSCRVFN